MKGAMASKPEFPRVGGHQEGGEVEGNWPKQKIRGKFLNNVEEKRG